MGAAPAVDISLFSSVISQEKQSSWKLARFIGFKPDIYRSKLRNNYSNKYEIIAAFPSRDGRSSPSLTNLSEYAAGTTDPEGHGLGTAPRYIYVTISIVPLANSAHAS